MAKEPIPSKEFQIPLNHFFLSAGKTLIYQVVSGMSCRLYWQDFDDPDLSEGAKNYMNWGVTEDLRLVAPTAWKTESAWYEKPGKGWVRDGANFPSYQVRYCEVLHGNVVISESITDITVRWKPIFSATIEPLIAFQNLAKDYFSISPVRPDLLDLNKYETNLRRIAA